MEEESIQPNTNRISNNNVSVPKPNNKVLDSLLAETAQGDEWKSINKEASTKSVQDNVQQLPDHLANAFTKDYSQVMKKADEKSRGGIKNGA